MTEEERAAAYRAEQASKLTAEAARLRMLTGSPAARSSLAAAWLPPMLADGPLQQIAPGMFVGRDDLVDDGIPGDLADIFDVLA